MKQPVRYTVEITNDRNFMGLAALLDMLRYDRAIVRGWDQPDGNGRFVVELEAERPEIDRWKSFGIYPQVQS